MTRLPVLLLLLASPAWAEPPKGQVRSVRGASVYLDLGRVHGLRVGDELPTPSGKVRVVHLGERQAMAEVLSGPVPRPGAPIQGLREPTAARPTRPVVTLPAPTPPPELPWTTAWARRATLVPAPTSAQRPADERIRGDLRLGWFSLLDDGPGDLDLHQAELRSTLDAPALAHLGGGRLGYRHDLAARLELGPGLASRAGADSRPYYRLRELSLRWTSAGWAGQGSTPETFAVSAALGRLALWEHTSPGLIDGARADLALGEGLTAGLFAGVVPALLDASISADAAALGGSLAWTAQSDEPGDWRARAAITSTVALYEGALSRVDLGLSGLLALGRDFDLTTSLIATSVDPELLPGQPALSLTRGHAGLRVRPAWWLTIDGSYGHDRVVADRELVARLGTDATAALSSLALDARESAWLQLRFDPSPDLTVAVSGNLGFGSDAASQEGGALRVTLRDLGLAGLAATASYRVTQTTAVQAHSAGLDLGLELADLVLLDLGYTFSTFHARLLDERQDEHRVTLGADLLTRGPWRVHLRGFAATGHLPGQLGLSTQLVWRFR